MTNVGRWAQWYHGLQEPEPYGDTRSYYVAGAFLKDCEVVADWGCGKGFFKTVRPDCVGVDGTLTAFSDVVADLTRYVHFTDGVLLRHVLEHNYDWPSILNNAISSAQYKLCIVLFTPMSDQTHVITVNPDIDVPDIGFRLEDITGPLGDSGAEVKISHFASATQYGEETVVMATWA